MSETAGQHFYTEALARARNLRAAGDLSGAWRELRIGMDAPVEYSMATSAAKFLENSSSSAPPPGWPIKRVALIGSDTLTFIRPVLRALAFRDGWWPIFYEAPFGVWRQEILTPNSALRHFQPEVTLILRSWHSVANEEGGTAAIFNEEISLMQQAAQGLGVVVWPGYDFPEHRDELRKSLVEINERLHAALLPDLLWLDLANLQSTLRKSWHDDRLWEAVRQHPSPVGIIAITEAWLALLRARWGQARKVLVTDLDNVLWGGVLGEDGVDGVKIGGDSPAGQAHANYQQYLVELRNQGVLLAVCSKNNEQDVQEIFSRRSMPLKREDFVGWMVNWTDKAENLRTLARKLNLGLDSMVFVDDNPVERDRVRQSLPEVAVPELSYDPSTYVSILQKRRFFTPGTVSAEDRNRTATYQANEQREELRAGTANLDDFLQSLDMTAELGDIAESTLERAEQLLVRTNQWNLTTRRHSRAKISDLLAEPNTHMRWFRLKDRFGDHGLVGLWILRANDSEEWEIDSWVMSCRVIARGLEDLMFNAMIETASKAGARRLRGIFRPTSKNNLVANLFPLLGFQPLGKVTDGEQAYVLELSHASLRPHHIRLSTAN